MLTNKYIEDLISVAQKQIEVNKGLVQITKSDNFNKEVARWEGFQLALDLVLKEMGGNNNHLKPSGDTIGVFFGDDGE